MLKVIDDLDDLHQILVTPSQTGRTGRETFKSENYTLQRNEDGDIAI